MKTDTGRNALRHHDPPFGEVEDDRCHSRNASEHKPAVKAPRPLINRSHCVRANKPTQISNGINQRDSGRRRRSCLASRSLEASSFPSMCCSGNSSPSQSIAPVPPIKIPLAAGLLTVTLAIPWMFEGWQVGPVLFAGQGLPRRFALSLLKKHPAQVVAAVYRI